MMSLQVPGSIIPSSMQLQTTRRNKHHGFGHGQSVTYHVRVVRWSETLVVKIIPSNRAEENVVFNLQLKNIFISLVLHQDRHAALLVNSLARQTKTTFQKQALANSCILTTCSGCTQDSLSCERQAHRFPSPFIPCLFLKEYLRNRVVFKVNNELLRVND